MALTLNGNDDHPDPMDEAQRLINPMMGDVNVGVLIRAFVDTKAHAIREADTYDVDDPQFIVLSMCAGVFAGLADAFGAASRPGAKV